MDGLQKEKLERERIQRLLDRQKERKKERLDDYKRERWMD